MPEFNAMKRKELHAMLELIFSLNGGTNKSCAFITKVTGITFSHTTNLPADLGGYHVEGGWNILIASKESKRDAIRGAYMKCF
jgi:hypothetical protein